MGRAKLILYGIAVVCFLVAGLLDLHAGELKLGIVALLFAAANGVIFFWR